MPAVSFPRTDKDTAWESRLFRSDAVVPQLQDLKFALHRKLLDRIDLESLAVMPADRAKSEVRSAISALVDEERAPLSLMEKERIVGEVLDEVFGLGPLEPLLRDSTISDILVTTPSMVYIERAGKLYETPVRFKDDKHLLRIIEKIVSRVGRRIDESSPMVDARLADGSRVNAVIPPLAVDGPLLSIRRFGKNPLQPIDLLGNVTLTEPILQLLEACVKARLNIVISGGTGSGKTTLLNVLSGYIPSDERIVTIEDAAELQLHQRHVARMETRPPNVEGRGDIHMRQLVINALRMRPDRIIVGEVRGEEALDMLQAMNTGHDGSLTTVHSNSPRDAIGRLQAMVGMANSNMSVPAIREMISSAVNLFVHIARMSDGTRRVTHLTECVGMEGEHVTTQDIFVFQRLGVTTGRKVIGRFRATGIRPKFCERLEASGFHVPATVFEHVLDVGADEPA
ncbi:MAG: CpaF family protein [Bryobacteraceae bacterium]